MWPSSIEVSEVQRLAERRSCLLSYSQAEQERELIQPRKHLLAEPCMLIGRKCCPFTIELSVFNMVSSYNTALHCLLWLMALWFVQVSMTQKQEVPKHVYEKIYLQRSAKRRAPGSVNFFACCCLPPQPGHACNIHSTWGTPVPCTLYLIKSRNDENNYHFHSCSLTWGGGSCRKSHRALALI